MASVKKMANPLGDEGSQEAFRTVGVSFKTKKKNPKYISNE